MPSLLWIEYRNQLYRDIRYHGFFRAGAGCGNAYSPLVPPQHMQPYVLRGKGNGSLLFRFNGKPLQGHAVFDLKVIFKWLGFFD